MGKARSRRIRRRWAASSAVSSAAAASSRNHQRCQIGGRISIASTAGAPGVWPSAAIARTEKRYEPGERRA